MRTLVIVALILLWTSCISESGTEATDPAARATNGQESSSTDRLPEVMPTSDSITTVAAKANPEVLHCISSFNRIKDDYMLALKEADAMKIQELNMQYMDWYQHTQELQQQLNGAELNAFKAKLAEMNKAWEAAAEAAVQ